MGLHESGTNAAHKVYLLSEFIIQYQLAIDNSGKTTRSVNITLKNQNTSKGEINKYN